MISLMKKKLCNFLQAAEETPNKPVSRTSAMSIFHGIGAMQESFKWSRVVG
jgi:hypothetical protein